MKKTGTKTDSPSTEAVALGRAMDKLRILDSTDDPHLFARFNTDDARALLAELKRHSPEPKGAAPSEDGKHG